MNNINQKIPEGWSVKKLGEVFDTTTDYVAAGSFADLRDKVNYLDVPSFAQLVRTVDIKNNFNNDGFVYINQSAYDFLWRVHLDEESIILPNIGANIGEVYFLSPGKLPYSKSALGPNAILLRSSKENLFYLYCFCQTVCFRNLLDLIVGASGQPKFNKTDLKTIEILLPPLPEQEKIARILGTWDEAIEKLSSLIEQKKLLKKGLMQRLLTGKTRLKGFTQPWKDCELSDLLDYEQPSKYIVNEILEYSKTKTPVLTANKAFILGSTDDTSGIYTKGTCIIFDDFTTDIKYVNFPFKVKSSAIKILTSKENVILKFVFEQMKRIKYPLGGHKRYYLSEYQYITIRVPDIVEQKAIADVLSTADEEIDLLNKKLEALKEQKKGLMQQLLTGQTRVKVN